MLPDLLFAILVLGASANMTSENALDTGPAGDIQRGSRPCSMDALSPAAKQRMIGEYNRRKSAEGQAKADAWAMEEGNRFRRQLVAEGVCPPLAEEGNQTAAAKKPDRKPPLRNRQGKTCKNVGVENRMIPNFGGAPMTMVLVPVCKD